MSENNILIFGHGKWSKKIIKFLMTEKKFNEIYVKTSSRLFKIFPKKKELDHKEFKSLINNIKYLHICTPTNSHFDIVRKNNLHNKKIIIEKPLVYKKNDLENIESYFKSNKIIVNYIDLYNPSISKINEEISSLTSFNLDFGNNISFFKKKECLNEWLDHPLAIVLTLFKKFSKFKILYYKNVKIKNKYIEKLHICYSFKKTTINLKINLHFPKHQRIIKIKNKSSFKNFNFRFKPKEIVSKNGSYKNNSFNYLYDDLLNNKYNNFQNYEFHKKIFIEKEKIIQALSSK